MAGEGKDDSQTLGGKVPLGFHSVEFQITVLSLLSGFDPDFKFFGREANSKNFG